MAEKKVIELEINSNLGTLKQQFKEAQIEVQALSEKFGATSAQAVEAAKSAAILKDKISDAKSLTDAFNPDAKFKAVTGALTGVAGGFSVVTGALGAFGKQNEDVEKALLKVQSAMALASGAQAIGESIDSFKQLGAVIKATSIYQGIYNFVQTGSIKGLAQTTIAKVADTQATVAQGTAMVATSVATTGATLAAKALRVALITTGVGALLVAAGLLITNFDYLKEKFNNLGTGAKVLLSFMMPIVGIFWAAGEAYNYFTADSIKANAKFQASTKKSTEALNAQVKANDKASTALKTKNGHEYKMAEASGASASALHKLAIRHANEEIALERASKATAHNTYVKEKNTLAHYRSIDASDETIKKQEELVKATRENSIKEGKDLSAALENKAQLIRDNEVKVAGDRHTRSESNHEKSTKTEKGQAKEKLDITKNVEDENIRLMDEGQAKEEAVILLAYKRKKEEQDKNLKDKVLKQADYDTLQKLNAEGQEADLLAIEQKYTLQAEEARKTAQEKKEAEFLRQENLLAELTDTAQQKLYDKYKLEQEAAQGNAELLLALKKKYDKDVEDLNNVELEKKRTVEEKKIQMAMDGLSIINDLFQMNAGKSEKDARRAFKAQKAFNLASALTNTYLAVTSALATKVELFPGQRFIEAGLAGAAGAVQVAKIAKTQFEGGGSSASGGGGGGGATAPTMSAPQFNVVGQSGVNQLASLNQQPIQAYVVSGQVTSQQALDRNRLANATLGG
jgi:hypothetical protein